MLDHLWLFALLLFGIIIVPGMDMAFVMSSALVGGRRGGLAAVAGIVTGGFVHLAMGLLGVGLLLQMVPGAFDALLVAGAAYVAWIGWAIWKAPPVLGSVDEAAPAPAARTFRHGMVTSLLNPKAYMFMIAVFPQFVRPEFGPLGPQALAVGVITAVTQSAVYGAVALGAAAMRLRLAASTHAQLLLGRAVALFLFATAAWSVWHSATRRA